MVAKPAPMPAPTNLAKLLQCQVQLHPEKLACAYLADNGEVSSRLDFASLDLKARALAARLQGLDAGGEAAVLLYPPGLDFIVAFFACVYANVLAIPLPMPRGKANFDQTKGIIEDTKCEIILSTQTFISKLLRYDERYFEKLICVDTQLIDTDLAYAWQPVESIAANDVAYLQYTSGSTSARKGVMVTHANVLENIKGIDRGFAHTDTSIAVNWLPHFHDLGLVSGILQPLYHGNTNYLMAPTALVQRPVRWLSAISKFRATHTNSPNYAYDLCVKKIMPDQTSGLDLSAWRVALNGAEPVRADTVSDFYEKFKSLGLRKTTMYPAYGLAEATLVVSAGLANQEATVLSVDANALEKGSILEVAGTHENSRKLVGCGEALDDTVIAIVDPKAGSQLHDNEVGEIWVSGPAVAAGYWHDEQATQETFGNQLENYPGRSFLRTGDLGFLRNRQLYITGREKDLIIVRGANHYPQDIEWTVENCHSAFKSGCGAAFSITDTGSERLIVVFEIERDQLKSIDVDEVTKVARRRIAEEHDLQLHGLVLLKTATVPRTSSGKIQRRQCKKDFLAGNLEEIGRWIATEQAEQQDEHNGNANDQVQGSQSLGRHSMSVQADTADGLIEWLRSFAEQRLNSRDYDERRMLAPHVILELGNNGVLGLQTATEYGGLGLSCNDTLRVIEQLAAIDLTMAMMTIVHNTLGIATIERAATDELKKRLLPQLASGRELVAFAISEPSAGSNPRAIRTIAKQVAADKWQLTGEKIWSGSAGWSSVINVFAQHHDIHDEPQGMIGFVVPVSAAGVEIGPEARTFGMRGMVQNTITFTDVVLSKEQLLGEPGGGMGVAQHVMQRGRLMIAAACVGGMKRCLQLMVRYGENRTISTGRLINNGLWLSRVAEISHQIYALEKLIARVGMLEDKQVAVAADIFAALKITAPELLWSSADSLMQMLGGRGYIEDNIAPQLLRDARVARILEGPTEALQMFLGARVTKDPADYYEFLNSGSDSGSLSDALIAAVESRAPQYGADHAFLCAVGETAAQAVLVSCLQTQAPKESVAHQQSLQWARKRFDQLLGNLNNYESLDSAFDAARLRTIVAGYSHSIGDIEQQLPGLESGLNGLLERDQDLKSGVSKNNSQQNFSSPLKHQNSPEISSQGPRAATSADPKISSGDSRSLAAFMAKWLDTELKLAAGTVKTEDTFFEHGVDSVVSVMLTVAIEEEFGFLVEPEVVYDYPRINACATEIARQIATATKS
ncbi:MAG: AMP-binding protein [Gammaproteobacteria bacterium]